MIILARVMIAVFNNLHIGQYYEYVVSSVILTLTFFVYYKVAKKP